MAKAAKKKKRKSPRIRKSIIVLSAVVLWAAFIFVIVQVQHNRAVTADKNRFTQAGKDVKTVADQIVAAAGQPQDRKDGGKCTYAHQKYSKGPLSCEVYSYLAYGVNSPDEVNAIVQKAEAVQALHGTPWKFEKVTEKPHQFVDGVNYTDNFVILRDLFDTETKTVKYNTDVHLLSCGISYYYHNSLSKIAGYPSLYSPEEQQLFLDISCTSHALSAYYSILG